MNADLEKKIRAQVGEDDAKIVLDYLVSSPGENVHENPEAMVTLNDPHYVDRGMWGPLGGPKGTVSKIWLENWKYDGPSEVSLMTVIPAPGQSSD